MKVKICGITRLEDALLAVESGAWAVGFIFVKNTPRYIEPANAKQIIDNLPQNIEKVGVFADLSENEVFNISKITGITKIQLHGCEPPEYCCTIKDLTRKEIIKAIRIKSGEDLAVISQYQSSISYILLDTFSEKELGGTGKTFDWNIAKQAKNYNIPLILAGGLNPENITGANKEVMPFALDLSSGLESTKSIKDPEKLKSLKNIIKAFKGLS